MQSQAVKNKTGQPDKKAIQLSKEPEKAMQEMMDIIDTLRGVMVQETEALKQARTNIVMEIQDAKMAAAQDYQDGIFQLMARKDEMKSVSPTVKNRLEKTRLEFKEIAETNKEALERMRKGLGRLSDRIMSSAKQEAEKSQKFVYGHHGKLEGSGKASMGVNESA